MEHKDSLKFFVRAGLKVFYFVPVIDWECIHAYQISVCDTGTKAAIWREVRGKWTYFAITVQWVEILRIRWPWPLGRSAVSLGTKYFCAAWSDGRRDRTAKDSRYDAFLFAWNMSWIMKLKTYSSYCVLFLWYTWEQKLILWEVLADCAITVCSARRQ